MIHVLCIVQAVVPSTEISIIKPFNYLQQAETITWSLVKEEQFSQEFLNGTDIVVFHRNCRPNALKILQAAKETGIPVLYEIDDNYLELPEDTPIGRYMHLPPVQNAITTFFKCADLVKVGSPELNRLVAPFNTKIIHHPYAIDFSLLEAIQPLPHPNLTIGYAGSIHHARDLQFLIHVIPEINSEYHEVTWEFAGAAPPELDIPNLSVSTFEYNYETFLRQLAMKRWDIGLAPLLNTPANRCKTDNKFREYSACYIPTVFSKIPPYLGNIQDGVTGILAENTPTAWISAIRNMINNPCLRQTISTNAHQWVKDHNSLAHIASLWEELFKQMITEHRKKGGQ